MSVTPLIVRGYSLSGPATGHVFRPYRYQGDDPYVPPAEPAPTDRACSVDGCAGKRHAKGFCGVHYHRHRTGMPLGRDNRRKGFDPSFCGTWQGHGRHIYHKVAVCEPCRVAKNTYDRKRRAGGTK